MVKGSRPDEPLVVISKVSPVPELKSPNVSSCIAGEEFEKTNSCWATFSETFLVTGTKVYF